MSKVKDIFGKDLGITLSDIEDAIESDLLHENDEIELTDADRFPTKKEAIKKIGSELVSLLNSGRGMLIVGLAENDDKIEIRCVKTFKNKEQIRASVFDKIGSIPTNIKPFKLDIIPVSCKDGNIFLVEVQSNDLDCIYYSKIDNNVYIRRGDEAKSLELPDFLELLAKKNYARIYTEFQQKNDTESYLFDITLINEGLEPGLYVASRFEITTADKIKYDVKGKTIEKVRDSVTKIDDNKIIRDGIVLQEGDISQLGAGTPGSPHFLTGKEICVSIFRGHAGFPPNTTPVYPVGGGIIGELSVKKVDFKMLIEVDNYENRGHTRQKIFIEAKNGEITIEEEDRTFKPYLKL